MGYYTRFNLELRQINNVVEKDLSLESILNSAYDKDKDDILRDLRNLKARQEGQEIVEDPGVIMETLRDSNESAAYALDSDGTGSDTCKWYEVDEEMMRFSKRYPNWLFTMKGEGEEAGDLWVAYYQNGKMQKAKAEIVYEDFDPAKLSTNNNYRR